jgi:hypothetical protein
VRSVGIRVATKGSGGRGAMGSEGACVPRMEAGTGVAEIIRRGKKGILLDERCRISATAGLGRSTCGVGAVVVEGGGGVDNITHWWRRRYRVLG